MISARIYIFTLFEFLAEYRTERELLNGLIDGSVDAILLFDCGTVEMKRQPPHLTIVDASEFNLTIRVGFAVEEGNENLVDSPLEGKRCRCKRGRPCWRYCCLVVVRLMYGLTERLEFRRHKTAHLHSPLNENARWQFVCHHANKSLASNAGFCKQI